MCNFIDITSINICVCRVFVSFHAVHRPYANKKALGHYSTHTYGPAHKPQADLTSRIYTPQQRCNTNALVYYKMAKWLPTQA